jgi:hypothetical protein
MKKDRTLREQVEREHAQRYPDGCPTLCAACVHRLGLTDTEVARRNRERIAHLFKHDAPSGKAVRRG